MVKVHFFQISQRDPPPPLQHLHTLHLIRNLRPEAYLSELSDQNMFGVCRRLRCCHSGCCNLFYSFSFFSQEPIGQF